jgi:PPP family 3-phenylpropionic acid transporter
VTGASPGVTARPASVVPSSVVYAIQFVGVGVWVAYASVYFDSLGIGLALIGLLSALPSAVAILGAPAWGLVADRMGDVRPPYLAAALWSAGSVVVLATAPPMPWLVLAVIAIAVGTSGMTPLLDARTVQRLGLDRQRFGQARAWGSASFVASSIGVGVLIEASGYRAMFVVYVASLVGAGIAAAVLLGKAPRSERVGRVGPLGAVRLLSEPTLGLFFAGMIVVWVSAAGVMAFFSLRLVELGGDARMVGLGWAAASLAEVPTMLLFARLARRFRVSSLIVAGTGIFVVRAVLWSVTGSALGLVAVAALGGSAFALVLVGTTAYVAERAPAELRATAQALFSSTTFALGNILGAILAGLIGSSFGLAAVFPASAVGSAVGAALVWAAIARRR